MASRSVYFNGNLQRPYKLEESATLFVVRVEKGCTPDDIFGSDKEVGSYQSLLKLKAMFPRPNVFVYECLTDEASFRDKFKANVKGLDDPRLIFIGSVFQFAETGIYQLYTENIFLKFYDSISEEFIENFNKENDLEIKRSLNFGKNLLFVENTNGLGREIFSYCEKLLAIEEIECCHPELVTQLHPEFKSFDTQINSSVDLDAHWWLERTGAFDAWKTTKGKGVTIAIIDDGIELDHRAFEGRIVHPRDMLDKSMEELPLHEFGEGHGTACASVAGSSDKESLGVAPEVSIMPIKITGIGSVLQSEAFYWAVKHNADVISCSWGPPDGNIFSPDDDSFEFPLPDHTRLAFEYATTHGRNGMGCTIVFAAGNGKEPVKYDGYASSKDVFAVSSINYKDDPTVYSDYGSPVLCCFPSGDNEWNTENKAINHTGIHVADRLGDLGYSKDDYHRLFTGTSASCPGVAGVVSLMYSVNPFLKQCEIRKLLKDSCEKVGDIDTYDANGYNQNFGYGLLRADTALHKTLEFTKNQTTMATSKKQAVSLHIGINNVDTNFYGNFVPPLFGCVNDMKRMGELALRLGYETHFLEDNQATREAIEDKIIALGNTVEDGGILMITYAGHGAPIPDKGDSSSDTADSEDGFDEAWVTFNGFMLDDEINAALAKISSKIRVVTVSDSCHSESMTRFFLTDEEYKTTPISRSISPQATQAVLDRNGMDLEGLRKAIDHSAKDNAKVFVISLSACGKDELAKEINLAGRFTTTLLDLFDRKLGMETVNYHNFLEEVVVELNDSSQNPVLTFAHNESEAFKGQFPFSIENIGLDSGDSKKCEVLDVPMKSVPTKPSNSSISEIEKTPLFFNADALLIETDDSTRVKVPKESSSRSLARDKTFAITNGTIDANELKGHTDWDKAYNLLLANPDKGIRSIEPDTISSMYHIPKEGKGTRSAGDYLHTYPNPEDYKNANPFIWHLDDAHSQLKSANESVFPEIKMGKPNTTRKNVVKIGHIDTGFVENHPAIPVNLDPAHANVSGGKVKKGALDEDKKFSFQEQQGHGMATMSILAGNWVDLEETHGNYKGFFGAIPYAKVLTIKVSETVALLSGRNFAKAVDYAVDQGCEVITMSMAGLPSKVMAKAVNRAYEHGVVIVSAASNSFSKGVQKALPKRTLYPARYDRVVAATGVAYNHKPYLNRYHDGTRAAGGVYMQTCYGPDYVLPTSIAGYTPNISWFDQITPNADGSTTYYVKAGGGTSSATPQVAAGAAIYVQKYKKELAKFKGKDAWKKAEIVRQALFRSADKSTQYNFVYGTGIMRANDALAPEFAPAKMLAKIVKAEKAPEKRRFLGGFFGIFGNRSMMSTVDPSMQERLEDMMATEICQLLHKDANLFDYLDEINLEDPEFNISENRKLVKDILSSPHASDFLKKHLFSVPEDNNLVAKMNNSDHNNLVLEDASGALSIRASNVAYTMSNRKSYKETFDKNAVWVDEFEMQVSNSRGVRSDLASKMEIGVDSHLEDINSVMLVEKVYEEGSIFEWKYPDEIENKGTRSAAIAGSNTYSFQISEFTSTGERGFIDTLKRIGVKVFKWIKPDVGVKSKLLDKVVAKFGENRYEIKVYDLKGEDTLSEDGWMNIELLDKKKIYAAIQKDKKPVMVLMPGLFSTVESGFNVFLEVAAVRKALLKTHGRYVLGCNMPTVVQGVEANANKLHDLLKGHLKAKKCDVLARSRGGVVARFLFEDTWVNNSTLKPTAAAPLVLNKLVMFGTPNQGTMMTSSKNWKSMFNYTTNICRVALGTIAPVVPRLLTISKAIALGVVNLPGIDDLEETSKVLERLNSLKANRDNYFVFTSNYEPNQKLLKRLFDEFLVDRAIFKRQLNDSVTPVEGAVFQNEDFNNSVNLKESQYYIASAQEQVSHFGYLHPKHPQIIEKLWEVL